MEYVEVIQRAHRFLKRAAERAKELGYEPNKYIDVVKGIQLWLNEEAEKFLDSARSGKLARIDNIDRWIDILRQDLDAVEPRVDDMELGDLIDNAWAILDHLIFLALELEDKT